MAKDPDNLVHHRRKRRPGLHDLAQKLGVSHTAVARALRDDPRLSESLRKRVHAIAREEGYLASDVMQSLVSGWSGTIGVVVPTMVSYFISRIMHGLGETLWEDGVIPLVLCSDLDVDREEQMLKALAQKRVNGVVIMPCLEDRGQDHFVHLLNHHTPIVAINNPLPQFEAPLVTSDDDRGAEQVVRHLTDAGHRHILHLAGALDSPFADRRRETAYRRVMEEAGLTPHIIHTPHRNLYAEDIVEQLHAFFESAEGRDVTAVFAFNDPLAYCVYAYARRHGRTIGQDLALAGFGNYRNTPVSTSIEVDVVQPGLTSVEQHPLEMGRRAAEVLRLMMHDKPVPKQALIEPELIVRDSTAGTRPETSPATSRPS